MSQFKCSSLLLWPDVDCSLPQPWFPPVVLAFLSSFKIRQKCQQEPVSRLIPIHLSTTCLSPKANPCRFPRPTVSSSSFQCSRFSRITRWLVCSHTEVFSPPSGISACNPFGWNTLYSYLYLSKFFLSYKRESKHWRPGLSWPSRMISLWAARASVCTTFLLLNTCYRVLFHRHLPPMIDYKLSDSHVSIFWSE